jgi:hypothetical protein
LRIFYDSFIQGKVSLFCFIEDVIAKSVNREMKDADFLITKAKKSSRFGTARKTTLPNLRYSYSNLSYDLSPI